MSLASDWGCESSSPTGGERPVGSFFVKTRCVATRTDTVMAVSQHFFHKAGQTFIDVHTGKYLPEGFESETRFEEVDARFIDFQTP